MGIYPLAVPSNHPCQTGTIKDHHARYREANTSRLNSISSNNKLDVPIRALHPDKAHHGSNRCEGRRPQDTTAITRRRDHLLRGSIKEEVEEVLRRR